MTKRLYTSAILITTLFSQCQQRSKVEESKVFDLGRLVGRWESTDARTQQIEEWAVDQGKDLRGKGFVMEGADTSYIEFLSIKFEGNTPVYSAQVSNQNKGDVIPFRMSAQSKDVIEFSNPEHDFPQKIVYRLQNDSMLQAYIEGPRNNSTTRVTFDFKRSN
jgi:hypothetical protein